jgi:hypothetical protein
MRTKIYSDEDIPRSVSRMVAAICADYDRREHVIRYSAVSGSVLYRSIELNAAVERALGSVEVGIRESMLRDIALGVGYERSPVALMLSKGAYYRRRRKIIHDIAVNLSLM